MRLWMLCAVLLAGVSLLLSLVLPGSAAGEDRKLWTKLCASCHDGETAPTPVALKEKYGTLDRFHDAVMKKGARCMNILKNDEGLIRKVGLELGLKE